MQTTPFKRVYGRDPPSLLKFEKGSTTNLELEAVLQRDNTLQHIKDNLGRAQQLMKNNANKHRRDLQLEVGSQVFLKLRPYIQQFVARRVFQNLAAKYYGPFEVLEKIGNAAYRLKLLEK